MSKFRDQLPPLHVIYEWDFCHGSNNGINRNTVYDKTGQHYFKIDGCDFGNKKLIQNFSYLRYSTIDNPNDQYGADWTSVSTHDNIVTGNISSIQFFRWNEANNIDIYINKDWYIKIVGATIKRVCTYADVIDNPSESSQIPFEYLNDGIWHISPYSYWNPTRVAIILENQTQDTIYIQEVAGELSEDCEFNGWLDTGGLKLNDDGYLWSSITIKHLNYSSVAMIRSNNLIPASDSYANARIRTFNNKASQFLFEGYLSTANQYCISTGRGFYPTEDTTNSYIIPQSDYFTCFYNNKYNDQDTSVSFPWGDKLMDITLFWRAPAVTVYSFVYTNSGGSESFYDKLKQYMLDKYSKYINN